MRTVGEGPDGRHVVVTGAGTGIGRAIALRLASDGAALTLLGLDRARARGDRCSSWTAQRMSRPATSETARRSRAPSSARADALGPIHALVAVSGIGGGNGDDDPGGDRFDDLVQTNLNGTYYCARAALRQLAPGPDARHIVVISSILARIAVPGYTGYSASKAGLLGLVRSLAAELAPDGVHVNAICPGWVETDMAWQGLDLIAAEIGGTREDAYRDRDGRRPTRPDVAARRDRRHRRVAALAGRARRSPARRSTRTAAPACSRFRPSATEEAGCGIARGRW